MTAIEKNWCVWDERRTILSDSTSPKAVLLSLVGERADVVAEHDGPRWSYGAIRGGTTPLPYKENYAFFSFRQLTQS